MPVQYTTIGFNNPVNSSLQVGDFVYVSNILSGGAIDTPVFVGKVLEVNPTNIMIDKSPTVAPIITVNQYILFSKPIEINESSLKGYYADVTLENSSSKKTELFAVSSEVVPSSK